jgi:RimJ/RimL family protein N-acetyltransferase
LAAGQPAFWVGMFYIFAEDAEDDNERCVGGCGFKGVPRAREVEIGYGLAPSQRGRGYASAALAELLRMATNLREVDTVVLLIASDNTASEKLAQRAGFTRGDSVVDEDGDLTVRWTLRL